MVHRASTTLYFNGQFWCVLFESEYQGRYYAAEMVIGPEPGIAELAEWLHHNGNRLIDNALSGPGLELESPRAGPKKMNPKRAARAAAEEAREVRTSTASQEVLARQRDAQKQETLVNSKHRREARAQYIRVLKRAKAKAKHRGH